MYEAADEIPTDSLSAASFVVAGLIGAMEALHNIARARYDPEEKGYGYRSEDHGAAAD